MLGQYETNRDSYQLPDCWQMADNHCQPHFHSSLELTYVLSGKLVGVLGGQEYALGRNQLLLCPSYSLHYYLSPLPSQSIVLTVPTNFVPSFQRLLVKNTFAAVTATLPPGNEILRCLFLLKKHTHAPEVNQLLVKGYVYTLMGLLSEHLGLCPLGNRSRTDFTREVLLYLESHYLEALSPEAAAARFGYSKSRFSHLFSQNLGFTFWEYVNILRCRHAAMLIVNQSIPIIDAALSSGYDNIRTFYRNFKQVFKVTPSEYIAQSTAAPSSGHKF